MKCPETRRLAKLLQKLTGRMEEKDVERLTEHEFFLHFLGFMFLLIASLACEERMFMHCTMLHNASVQQVSFMESSKDTREALSLGVSQMIESEKFQIKFYVLKCENNLTRKSLP